MNIFKQIIVSLYSPKDISTFRTQGIGKTILFVFFLTLIAALPNIYFFSTSLNSGFHALENNVQNEIPDFTIKDGILQSNETAPITIKNSDMTIVFDSTGTISEENITQADNTLFILQDEFAYSVAGQTQSTAYSMLGDVTITKADIIDLMASISSLLPVIITIIILVIYIVSSAMKFVEVSILALFGLAIKNMMQKKSNYGQLWRLAAYSVTLPTIFFMVMDFLRTIVPNGFFIHWFVAIMMLLLSIKEIPSQKTE